MVAPKAPVVPCAMIDTFEFLPSGSFRPKLGIRPGVIFGEPLEFSRYYGKESDRTALRAVTDEIMQQIQKLSGQEYVDVYATQAKEPQQPSAESDLLRRPSQRPARPLGFAYASGSPYRRRRLPRP
jgi:1-acyl-sn-glycerol-3-phosphate acyltransferase